MTKLTKKVKVSPLIDKNYEFLHNFHAKKRSPRSQKNMIENASNEQLLCFVEICFNTLKGRVPLKKRHLQKLGAMKNTIRCLARARSPKSTRHILLTKQDGAGIPAIAGVLASILVPIVSNLITQKT